MKAAVYSVSGQKVRDIELPSVFKEEVDEQLIKRSVLSIQSAKLQPKGTFKRAGRENTAVYVGKRWKPAGFRGINVEHARLPRKKNRRALIAGDVASVPQAKGGPIAHPPKVEKKVKEQINKKEKRKAVKAAVAATADTNRVKERGHLFGEKVSFPIIVEKKLEQLEKTKQVKEMFSKLKIQQDVERAKKRKKIRAGKGKKRGRRYKRVKSVLIVVNEPGKIYKAARNLEGVEIVKYKDLNANVLAPGAKPGRLTVWSENAIKEMK